ncbi:MAG: 3-hydroxyacyl-CoA dehydrogenase family protein [Bacteroidota bacterium]|nr:3-hydroxyacyl-CoA dehydrogenase family protein [Bacteroidota bacterium]
MSESLDDFSLSKSVKHKGSLQKVGIVGCGLMGQQIAILVSQSGLEVSFIDITEDHVKMAFDRINEMLDDRISKWGLTANEKKLILSRIKGSTEYQNIADCDLVIEAVNTNIKGSQLEVRKDVFRRIEAVVRPDAVIASNTATLMISDIAEVLDYPERSISLHFISPVNKVNIIELVHSVHTNQDTIEMVNKFARMIDRKLIQVNESSGHVSTRIICALINEACQLLMEGVSNVSDIDETMKEASGHQFGPFELADRIGLDKLLKWMENLFAEFGETKYKPNPIIKRLVRANLLGRYTGEGFYKYHDGKKIVKKGPISNLGRE